MGINEKYLHVWSNNKHIGIFEFGTQPTDVAFKYDRDALMSISLSLPLDGGEARSAAYNYLEGLLPESGNKRLRMQCALNADSIEAYDLLDAVDSDGGLIFTKTDKLDGVKANLYTQ